jgi:DNA-binding LacI/PurR family transcriptional regulator
MADPQGKGVIIVDPYSVGPAQKKLAQMNVPFLHIGTDSLDGVHCVSENRSAAASALVAALVEDGHRRIGFVGSLDRPNHRTARDGYLEGVRPLNLGRRYIWDADDKTIHEAMEEIIRDPMRPDALLVMGGHLPIGALPVLLQCPAPPALAVFSENSAIVQLRERAYVAYYSQIETGRLAVRVLSQLASEEGTPARNHYSPFKILRPGQTPG